jgi:hypothetical protein
MDDEYSVKARPYFSSSPIPFFPSDSCTYLNKQTISSHIYFNIQFDYTIIFVPTDGKGSFGYKQHHDLYNVSMEQMMQETTFVSWFSKFNVPKDAFRLVFDKICQCANDMLSGEYKNLSVLTIRVDLVVTRPDEEEMEVEEQQDSELVPAITRTMKGESCEGDYKDEENNCLEEEEDEEEEDNELVSARAIEGESYEVDYEDYSGYGNQQKEQCASPTFSPFTKLFLLWEPTKRRKKNYFKK